MPRTTNRRYLKNRTWLADLWDESDGAAFADLSYTEQMYLHDYYALAENLDDGDAVAHRVVATLLRPSLPQSAGRALASLKLAMKRAGIRRKLLVKIERLLPKQRKRTRVTGTRNITVRAVARPKPDLERLARAIAVMAQQAETRPQPKRRVK